MKRLLIIVALAAGVAACNSNAGTNTQAILNTKRFNDSLKLDSFKRAEAVNKEIDRREAEAKLSATAVPVAAATTASVARRSSSSPKRTYVHHTYSQTTPAKKGWSSAAKGAAIGAGAGAVTGILVDKKDGRGAVIGGVLGAGTGYAIGRAKDKRTGRAQ